MDSSRLAAVVERARPDVPLLLEQIADEPDGQTIPVLSYALGDGSESVRLTALYGLRDLAHAHPDALLPLASALQDESPQVRIRAAWALVYRRPGADVARAMAPLLRHREREVRVAAAEVFSELGPAVWPYVADLRRALHDSGTAPYAAEALGGLGPPAGPAVPDLMLLIRQGDAILEAIEALGRIGPDAASSLPMLVEAIAWDRHCAIVAVEAIGGLRSAGAGALDAVVAYHDRAGTDAERAVALGAIGRIAVADDRTVPLLRAALRGQSPVLQRAALQACNEIHGFFPHVLCADVNRLRESPDPQVQRLAEEIYVQQDCRLRVK